MLNRIISIFINVFYLYFIYFLGFSVLSWCLKKAVRRREEKEEEEEEEEEA